MQEPTTPPTMPTIQIGDLVFRVQPFMPPQYEMTRGDELVTLTADVYDWWTGAVQEGHGGPVLYVTEKYLTALEAVDALMMTGWLP